MQIDMHYYGVYSLARAAGLNEKAAKIVATASQFVDDNATNWDIDFADGGRIYSVATAHHAWQIKNIDREDQRKIWVSERKLIVKKPVYEGCGNPNKPRDTRSPERRCG